ncbi:MAG: hypothetical protein ACE5JD_12350 [Candidatus Methylomirabilia bacterium]
MSTQPETKRVEIRYLDRPGLRLGLVMSGQASPLLSRWAPMAVALGVWICTLPFVALLLAPWLGFTVAGWAAVFVLVITAGLCWGLCSVRGPDWLADRGERR